jgi:hypothetical protein
MKTKPRMFSRCICLLPAIRVTLPLLLLALLFCGGAPRAQGQGNAASTPVKPEPDYNAPWTVTQPKAAPAAATPSAAPVGTLAPGSLTAAPPVLRPPKSTKHEISFAGDFMMAEGTVTMPVGYSLKETLGDIPSLKPTAVLADRSSMYYGGTLSYSYGQAWYVDLSWMEGRSSGSQSIDAGWLGSLPSDFKITDDWLQAYVRYTFPRLRGKRFSAYLRAGASFVQADLTDESTLPAGGRYTQTDQTQDILGNVGVGVGYSLYTTRKWRLGAQLEAEGFYGTRTQDSLEYLSADEGLVFKSASIDNTLYGGIGRATLRFEYRMGSSGLFKLFGDVGGQVRRSEVSYPGVTATPEMIWGPYVRFGLRYAF